MDKNQVMRKLPKIGALLEDPDIQKIIKKYNKNFVTRVLRDCLEEIRLEQIKALESGKCAVEKSESDLKKTVISLALKKACFPRHSLKRTINATGIVLHTNLGRAPLPDSALEHISEVASSYSNLEYDIQKGERGDRHSHVNELICDITGAEDAIVVNNNAGAVLLCLSSLAFQKEVIISRGQLVEIGGSFRIPEVMALSGAKLIEVGTTNKTHLSDYERAINENTGVLLKVHQSNFKMVGFTSQVSSCELKTLAKKHGLPLMEDLGSGVLVDLRSYGFPQEPTVQESVKSGIDIITFSGDKLLGGPQAGIIVGRSKYISTIKHHPLARALRIDKLTLAALESVLALYRDEELDKIPIIKLLKRTPQEMQQMAQEFADRLNKVLRDKGTTEVLDDYSQVGGGSLPDVDMPTKTVALNLRDYTAKEISAMLRMMEVPVIGRIKNDRFMFDVRTMNEDDISKTIELVEGLL
ncbi:MAG: L-seryl-tRNA(Sec) selenium transferase [Tepidanaerobacteraceae bacterium]